MCGKYVEFFLYSQPFTVGGTTGNYDMQSPVPNAELVEWAVIAVNNSASNSGSAIVSADLPDGTTAALKTDGSQDYTTPIPGIFYHAGSNAMIAPPIHFYSLRGQNIHISLVAGASSAMFVTLQFRWLSIPLSVLNALSADPISLDGEHENQINKAREQRVNATISRVESMTHAAKRR